MMLRPMGPVTGEDAETLKIRLLEAQKQSFGRFVVDIGPVPFIDGMGLEALVDVTDVLAKSGQSLKLCGANDVLREVLQLTGLAPRFEHFEDANSAVRSFL
jgi:anti-anti-sigma factor